VVTAPERNMEPSRVGGGDSGSVAVLPSIGGVAPDLDASRQKDESPFHPPLVKLHTDQFLVLLSPPTEARDACSKPS